jgi:hypothetical protein
VGKSEGIAEPVDVAEAISVSSGRGSAIHC